PARPEDVLALKEARLALRQAGSAPPSVAFERVEIDWPYVLVDRSAEGIFPFSLLAAAAPAPAERAPLPTVRIDALRVRGARIDFRDATLSPPYWRALANLRLEARAVEAPAVRVGALRAPARALTKDYRGDIALGRPFGGNLSEPSFSMRTVVLQGIVEALRGAVLSPLNALGRVLLRGGRIERIDLDAIPFPPGAREP